MGWNRPLTSIYVGFSADAAATPPLPLEAIAGITRALLCAAPTSPGHQLDSDYYDRGLAARRRERPILGELDDLLDQFDDILARFTT